MNTERDNFYDWAKEKPDSTRFSSLESQASPRRRPAPAPSPWTRLALFAAVVIALSAGYHFFLG